MPANLASPRALLAALVVGATAVASHAPASAQEHEVLRDGAVVLFDVSLGPDDAPRLAVRTGDRVLDPAETDVEVGGDLARTVLADPLPPGFAGLLEPGATVYQVPATQTEGLPNLGWSAVNLPVAGSGPITVELELEIAGPGDVVAYGSDDRGAPVGYVDTRDDVADRVTLEPGGWAWPVWIFEEPGAYEVGARPTLVRHDGSRVAGPTVVSRVVVTEPEDPDEPTEPPVDPGEETPDEPTEPSDPTEPPDGSGPPPALPGGSQQRLPEETECDLSGLAPDAVRVDDGHFDYGVQVKDGELRTRVKDDRTEPAQWLRPASVLFSLGAPAEKQVPDAAQYAFLGEPGDPVWTIGQTQESGVPWLGWNTQHPSAVEQIDGPTTWRLDAVEGPGELYAYTTGSLGALQRLMSLEDGWPRRIRIGANTHAHGNLTFTEPGGYRVTTTHSATLASGETVSSRATLYFEVGVDCADVDVPDDPGPDEPGDPDGPDAPDSEDPDGGDGGDNGDNGDSGDSGDSGTPGPPALTGTSPPTAPGCVPGSDSPGTDGGAEGQGDEPSGQEPIGDGHYDFGPEIADGELLARVKDERTQPPSWVAPESFRFVLGAAAQQRIPEGGSYSFLGEAGDPVWMMPQTQVAGVPWLGWNTQHETVRAAVSGDVTFTLDSVTGPGELAVYLTDSFGGVGEKVVGSVDGFPRSFDVPLNVHAHGNWAFTAPGAYQVRMTQSATLAEGGTVSGEATLSFEVGSTTTGRGAAPSGALGGAPALHLAPALAQPPQAADPTESEEPEESEGSEEDAAEGSGTDPEAAAGPCLPPTGADEAITLLLPLGVTLVVAGCGVLLMRRRAVVTARAA